jgi:hypothetical protein
MEAIIFLLELAFIYKTGKERVHVSQCVKIIFNENISRNKLTSYNMNNL